MKKTLGLSQLRSPLKQSSRLRPFGSGHTKAISASLMLTSLVDALVIIVIYLMVNSSTSEQFDLKDGIKLPQASTNNQLDTSPVVTFKDGMFFIDQQMVPAQNLREALTQLAAKTKGLLGMKEPAIVIEADEEIGFEKLQPLMVASAYAGIKQVKFAVLQKD